MVAARRSQLGGGLVQVALGEQPAIGASEMRPTNCHITDLAVFPGNTRARELYERHGYGFDLLRMAKPLSQ